ncbi:FadR/GntR family transcriptional regulator [Salipiger marinus]|uniref:FadR/GntR family transcriptional regulator n=1 Tax=Salipiger marinus TaxID=555512 RepID=UPI000E90A8A1|nr:FCD domain-containing protein [Salipiger manganoxidans]MCD1616907.1 FCD domain-containing protein [Salipiger manganoxidans]MEB3419986.1 FCD domain-containing protein [Salipiger manganoxidans]HBT03090.1 FadR family transcriptional regulator [Citreicella sp.]
MRHRQVDPQNPRPNLVQQLADSLRAEIAAGAIPVGGRLPSESRLSAAHGVSRTVVREAVAALRADGLVAARQGAGVFVQQLHPHGGSPFQDIDPERISSILDVLELRAAVEIEAAGLAAQRRAAAQEEALFAALAALEAAHAAEGSATAEDFAFHRAVAEATQNPRFAQFLDMLGPEAIPRARLSDQRPAQAEYLAQIQREHRAVAHAISARDAAAARAAMRDHLEQGQARYRRMLRR